MNQWRKGIAQWRVGETLYISVPFTWLMEDAEAIAADWKGPALVGGPGTMKPSTCEGFSPVLFHNPCATFTTRGCPNACLWCAVPKLEPKFRVLDNFRPAPMICDNNLLAAHKMHVRRVTESLKQYPLVDFNQGLDARRFTPEIADLLGNLKCKVRFALDIDGMAAIVKDAVDLCRKRTTKDIGVYVLIGFRDSPPEALSRLELVRSWGIRPTPMRFQPLNAKHKNDYVGPGWTQSELLRMMKYYSRLRYYEHIEYDDFRGGEQRELFAPKREGEKA